MKRILLMSTLFLSLGVFSQTELSEISAYYEAETSILSYRFDGEIQFDREKGYGVKLKTPHQFTSFAVGWIGQLNQHPAGMFDVVYKVHKHGKGWTDWKSDEGFTNIGETKNHFNQSNLLFGIDEYLHDSVEFYISCPENEVIDTLFLITMDISASLNQEANIKSSNVQTRNCPALPEIIPRADWCGDYTECHNPTYTVTYRDPTHTVIHHGASPDSYTDGYAVVRSYWNYHVNTLGWNDIGYNYLLDKYGNLFQGRHNPNMPTQDVHAAHVGNANPYSIGVNFLGNSDAPDTQPTTVQLDKCAEFLAWWYDQNGFDPTSSASILKQDASEWITLPRICGHRDVNPGGTTCPGDALYALLPDMRTQTNQILIDCDDPTAPTTSIYTDRNWYNGDFSVSFDDADNDGGSGVKYSFYQVMDFDDTEWRANSDYGFFNDNFETAIHPEWTALWGTWAISSGHLLQSDEVTSNSNMYANIQQEIGNTYLYHWQQKISGSGTNRRSGMHFFCSEPTETGRGDSYMVYLRADNNTVQIYKYIDNSYSATGAWYITENFTINPDVWYDVKLIFDTNTGEMSLFINDVLAASTIDTDPFISGTAISFRTGECQTEYDNMKVYRAREQEVLVHTALSADAEIRYESTDSD
ncbi:MAG: N-acetylmuramoyl-L-alanine amidase, partial [Bacteroidota bacterium]|nr:N-acetylmuramoyl-L-alanine amidase [Bacteroidota bacterium]